MSYLIQQDFKKVIQADNLNQVIGSDISLLNGIELIAQAEAVSYLIQKYITTQEFTDTLVYNYGTVYKARQRVYLDALAYNPILTYSLNTLTLQLGKVYICTTAITVGEVFTISKWQLIGVQYAIFYVAYPYPPFDLYGSYIKGNQIWYNDKTYTCVIPTITYSHDAQLQSNSNQTISNVVPSDPYNGVQNWGVGVIFSVAVGILPTDTTKWVYGDNRSAQLVMYCCDIALYHIHKRIAPRNIPDLRVKAYDDAIKWLKMAGEGKITPDLPVIQPRTGGRIRHGGNVKNINQY